MTHHQCAHYLTSAGIEKKGLQYTQTHEEAYANLAPHTQLQLSNNSDRNQRHSQIREGKPRYHNNQSPPFKEEIVLTARKNRKIRLPARRPTFRLSFHKEPRIPQRADRSALCKSENDSNGAKDKAADHSTVDEKAASPDTFAHDTENEERDGDLARSQRHDHEWLSEPIDAHCLDCLCGILLQVVEMPTSS